MSIARMIAGSGSGAWDVAKARYVRSSSSVFPYGLYFRPDGTEMFSLDVNSLKVRKYSMSAAWNVATASYSSETNISSIFSRAVVFKPDGTKMYVLSSDDKRLDRYSLSIPWDITSATLEASLGIFFPTFADSLPNGLFFKPDGTKMYVPGTTAGAVAEYNLSIAWSGTPVFSQVAYVDFQAGQILGLFFRQDGRKMYLTSAEEPPTSAQCVFEFNISTPWDVSTLSYVKRRSVDSEGGVTRTGVFFRDDGRRMYINRSGIVDEYHFT